MTGDEIVDPGRIGTQVRYWRLRRGLDRQQFADRVGKSTSWLDKVEKGERALVRLPVLEQVASALGISVDALVDPVEAERATRAPDAVEVAAIRGALGRYDVILGGAADAAEEPELDELERQHAYVSSAFLASEFSGIGRHLPKLIIEAQRLCERESDSVPAARLLIQTYRVASSTLLKLGADETAWLAADRAMMTAQRSGDAYCVARATRSVARAMMALGQTAESLNALVIVAQRMEPTIGSAPADTAAMYGMVLLAAEIAASRLDDEATAETMHEEALRLAQHRFSGAHDSATAFGVTNVGLHRVAAHVFLGQGERALEYARTIDTVALERLPRERRGTYLLDLATAHQGVGHHAEAVTALMQAERIAPEEVRCRPTSKSLITALIGDVTRMYAPELRLIARRAGVQT